MKQLILGTTAYSAFSGDADNGRLSHAYMLYLNDAKNLRFALKIFALKFFGLGENDTDGKRLINENLTDCRIYPDEGKKLTAEAVSEFLNDSALQPVEYGKKLYIISGFNEASALIQNKLLKTLEEPPHGVYFLLGVTSLAPVRKDAYYRTFYGGTDIFRSRKKGDKSAQRAGGEKLRRNFRRGGEYSGRRLVRRYSGSGARNLHDVRHKRNRSCCDKIRGY